MHEFKDTIATEQDFREIMGEPSFRVTEKTLNRLDNHCRAFIAGCPFLVIASSDGQGHFDLTPKGDPPGFVEILDDETLVIPERLGNRRADTFGNVLENPGVGLIFLVPGKKETLRISG